MPHLSERFAVAWRCFEAGRLAEAIERLTHLARDEPDHADAWHVLGLAQSQSGQHADRDADRSGTCLTD